MKTCKWCSETKPLQEFSKQKINKDGRRGECKKCRNAYNLSKLTDNFISKRRPPLERLMSRIEKVNGCWEWQGPVNHNGYGQMYAHKKKMTTHRFSYESFIGPVPDGLQIDHLCRNRKCCNPDHLEAVTQRENMLRGEAPTGINARKTHCIRGHEYTPENTRIRSKGYRMCRACHREQRRERRLRARS